MFALRQPDLLPVPLRLAAACCAARIGSDAAARIRALAEQADWEVMRRLFRRHRIEALAWRGLRMADAHVPDDTAIALRARADQVAAENLKAAHLMARLQQRFAGAGVDLLFIKGLTLGQLAYGSPLLKAAWDIDLLVNAADVAAAARLLVAEGFACTTPGPQDGMEGVVRWHRTAKESVWSAGEGVSIELHDALADHESLLPGIGMASPRQQVSLSNGMEFATLALAELYTYLTVHGGWSGWFRLKWLADLAALLAPLNPAAITTLHEGATRIGAGRASALALLLCTRLFGLRLDKSLVVSLERDRKAASLCRQVERALSGPFMLDEMTSFWWLHRVQFGLAAGPRYKVAQTREELRRAGRQIAKRLPKSRG